MQPTRSVYTVAVLWSALLLAYVGRQVLSLLVDPIRHALGLSDTQIGLLQGFAFGLCYAVAGLPLARLSDRKSRVSIAAACIGIWSVATMACGVVSSFPSLLAARALTAIAEAGISPAALSIVTDIFPRRLLGRASAALLTAPYIGSGLALLVGGSVYRYFMNHGAFSLGTLTLAPWQLVFLVVGSPGILVGAVVLSTLRESSRPDRTVSPQGLKSVLKTHRWFLLLYITSATLLVTVLYTQMAWIPAHFGRRYFLGPAEVGRLIGPTYIVYGVVGSIAAGILSSRTTEKDAVATILKVMLTCAVLLVIPAVATPLIGNQLVATCVFKCCVLVNAMALSLSSVPLQVIIPAHCRAQVIVLASLMFAVVGAGLGPIAVGALADHVFGGQDALANAIALVCGGASIGAAILLTSLRNPSGPMLQPLSALAPSGILPAENGSGIDPEGSININNSRSIRWG